MGLLALCAFFVGTIRPIGRIGPTGQPSVTAAQHVAGARNKTGVRGCYPLYKWLEQCGEIPTEGAKNAMTMKSCVFRGSVALLVLGALVLGPSRAYAHCQVPCGIYGDQTRFEILAEHITTIEKAIKQIKALSGDGKDDANQRVRWVLAKDDHADKFANIVTYYFLQQRVKLDEAKSDPEAYAEKLGLCHQLLVYAMKTKQSTDIENVEKLRGALAAFRKAYLGEEAEAHSDAKK